MLSDEVRQALLGREEFRARVQGERVYFRCPRHEDDKPSAWMGGGAWGCFACVFEESIATLAPLLGIELQGRNGRETETVYQYHDEEGRTLFEVVRFPDKRFRQRRPNGEWNVRGIRRVPYRLPAVIDAVARQDLVYVVEGEKDAHALMEHGAVATCNPGGAGKWNPAYNEHFTGATVVIVADRDKAGYEHAREIEQHLTGVASVVTVVEAAEGKDASDHLAAGFGPMDFVPARDAESHHDPDRDDVAVGQVVYAIEPDDPPADVDPERDGLVTDTANASRLYMLHGHEIRYVAKWGAWFVWTGSCWERDDQLALIGEMAKDVGRSIVESEIQDGQHDSKLLKWGLQSLGASKIRGMIELARGLPGIRTDHEDLDADPWVLNVGNGTLDLRSGTLRPADPADLLTLQIQVHYDPGATCPRWDQALAEWFPDPEVRDYVQRIVGAALVGEQRDHVFVIHFGHGANGKGTFVRAITNTLGPYAATPHMSLLVATRNSEHDTVKATLFRKRLAVASETARRVSLAESSVKNLTGRDRISCRRLYENPWEFEPSHSLWLQTNHLPRISGRDHGIWRRIRVVPWTATFKPAAEDLDAILAAEAAGILAWMVEGCRLWQERGLEEPDAVVAATRAYRQAEDVFGRFQADSGISFGKGSMTVTDINDTWKAWADENGQKHRMGEFRDWLIENGAEQIRESGPGTRKWVQVCRADKA